MSTRISARGEGGGDKKQKINEMSCNLFFDYKKNMGNLM